MTNAGEKWLNQYEKISNLSYDDFIQTNKNDKWFYEYSDRTNSYYEDSRYSWLNDLDQNSISTISATESLPAQKNISQPTKKIEEKKENENMNVNVNTNMDTNLFEIGPCTENDRLRLSVYGIAIRNQSSTWVSYDKKRSKIMNVDCLNIPNAGKYLFKMPAAISAVAPGDVIIHAKKPMFVLENNNGKLNVVDAYDGEEKTILPTSSPFGFDFVTKIVNLFDSMGKEASADNPFGQILPAMIMSQSDTLDPMIFAAMAASGDFNNINPMMFYFMQGSKMDPFMMYLMMQNNGFPNIFATGNNKNEASCNCDCHKEQSS